MKVPEAPKPESGRKVDGQVRQKSVPEGRKGHARAEAGNPQERSIAEDGQEPEAGHCDRTVGGSRSWSQGPAPEIVAQPQDFEEKMRWSGRGGTYQPDVRGLKVRRTRFRGPTNARPR